MFNQVCDELIMPNRAQQLLVYSHLVLSRSYVQLVLVFIFIIKTTIFTNVSLCLGTFVTSVRRPSRARRRTASVDNRTTKPGTICVVAVVYHVTIVEIGHGLLKKF